MSAHDQTHLNLEDAQSWDEEFQDYEERAILRDHYARIDSLEKEKERQRKLKENNENLRPRVPGAPRPLGLGAAKKPIRIQDDSSDEMGSPRSEIYTQAETRKTPKNPAPLGNLTNAPSQQQQSRASSSQLAKKAKLDEIRKKQRALELELGISGPIDQEEATKSAAESLEPDLIAQQKSALNNGLGPQYTPHYETIDLRYNRRVLRTKFTLDTTWTVERGQACFTTREGIPTTIEALIIRKKLKNGKRSDIAINLPVRCISSFYGGLKELVNAREEFLRSNKKTECQEIDSFGRLEDGSIDLSEMTQHGFPKCLIKLDGGYSIRVEEVCYNKGNFSGSYDTLCIKRSGAKEVNQEGEKAKAETENLDESAPAKDFKSFSIGVPLKLVTALYKSVEYIYKHEYQLLDKESEKRIGNNDLRKQGNPRPGMSSVLYSQYMAEKDRELCRLREENNLLKEENDVLGEKRVKFPESSENSSSRASKRGPPLTPGEERLYQELKNKQSRYC